MSDSKAEGRDWRPLGNRHSLNVSRLFNRTQRLEALREMAAYGGIALILVGICKVFGIDFDPM